MAGTFVLRIVSPEGNVLKEDAEFVVIPGETGEIGILPNHTPLVATMDIGIIRYNVSGKTKRIATSGGFAEVVDNQVTVLAETAESGEMIDLKRAMGAKERAEKRLANKAPDIDVLRAERALHRANTRIRTAKGE